LIKILIFILFTFCQILIIDKYYFNCSLLLIYTKEKKDNNILLLIILFFFCFFFFLSVYLGLRRVNRLCIYTALWFFLKFINYFETKTKLLSLMIFLYIFFFYYNCYLLYILYFVSPRIWEDRWAVTEVAKKGTGPIKAWIPFEGW
jgi:hypothetical protein